MYDVLQREREPPSNMETMYGCSRIISNDFDYTNSKPITMSNLLNHNNLQDTYNFRFLLNLNTLDDLSGTLTCDNSLTLPNLTNSNLGYLTIF